MLRDLAWHGDLYVVVVEGVLFEEFTQRCSLSPRKKIPFLDKQVGIMHK